MRIRDVTITVPDPDETSRFLASLFALPITNDQEGVTLTVGASRLTLLEGPTEPDGYYHLAFGIPENAVVEARDLLAARIPIFTAGDNGITTGAPVWNSHSVYFNAPGNLNLELIGRHRLPNTTTKPFALSGLLHISEVGVAVENPLVAVREMNKRAGLEPFGEPSESFAPVGGDDGLLIVVKHGRAWYPTTGQITTRRPLRIAIDELNDDFALGPSCTLTGISR